MTSKKYWVTISAVVGSLFVLLLVSLYASLDVWHNLRFGGIPPGTVWMSGNDFATPYYRNVYMFNKSHQEYGLVAYVVPATNTKGVSSPGFVRDAIYQARKEYASAWNQHKLTYFDHMTEKQFRPKWICFLICPKDNEKYGEYGTAYVIDSRRLFETSDSASQLISESWKTVGHILSSVVVINRDGLEMHMPTHPCVVEHERATGGGSTGAFDKPPRER